MNIGNMSTIEMQSGGGILLVVVHHYHSEFQCSTNLEAALNSAAPLQPT